MGIYVSGINDSASQGLGMSNISTSSPPYSINIAETRSLNYNQGGYFKSIGTGESVKGVSELQKLGAKRHFVNGDGSCWARATWQCVLSQVLTDDKKYDQFIQRIANPKAEYDIPQSLATKAIYIIGQLKELTTEQDRVTYMNHANVDNDLIFFMRHVAAEHMKFEYRRDQRYSMFQSQLHLIKTDKNRYGGPEMAAFVEYFDLELHTITQNDQRAWVHRSVIKGTTQTKRVTQLEAKDIPHNCLFGANQIHFEFISFAHVTAQGASSSNQKGRLTDRELNVIKAQIEADFRLAQQMQAEFDAEANKLTAKEQADKALAIQKQAEEGLAFLEDQRRAEQDARLAEQEQRAEKERAAQLARREYEDARYAQKLAKEPEPEIFPGQIPPCPSSIPTPPDSPRSSDSRGSSDSNPIPLNPANSRPPTSPPSSQTNDSTPPSSGSPIPSQPSTPTTPATNPIRSTSFSPTAKPVLKQKKSLLSFFSGVFSSIWGGLKTLWTWFGSLFRKSI